MPELSRSVFAAGSVRAAPRRAVLVLVLVLATLCTVLLGLQGGSRTRLEPVPGASPQAASASSPASSLRAAADPANILDLLAGLLRPPSPPSTPGPSSPASPSPQTPEGSPVAASTVKVSGVACGFRLEGSGFAAAKDTVLTNAHVVAGVGAPDVLKPDGQRLAAQVVMFDPNRDVALLDVPGLDERPLPLGPAVVGAEGLVYGHPHGQDALEVSPARVSGRQTTDVPDIYNRQTARRDIVTLTGDVQSGDSGAALVAGGSVVAMVFAVDMAQPALGYAIPSEDLGVALLAPRTAEGDSGPCLPASP